MRSDVPLLRVHDLSLTHPGAPQALPNGVSFDVHPGEFVLLLGPSGSGKSTLTLALNGLIPHALDTTMTGTVTVAGLDTSDTPVATLSTHVGMVFQDPDAQIVTGSVFDEVAFGPENLLLPVPEILERTEWALRRVGLWDRRHENPDVLSGGGRQRLAIACALALHPQMLVLDEPTANLDPVGVADVYTALRDLVADGDRAIVLIEHHLDAAISLATRVIALDQQGRIRFDGPVDEVLRDHAYELLSLGVWLPSATLTALRLRESGVTLHPLPLTSEELHAALATHRLTPPDTPLTDRPVATSPTPSAANQVASETRQTPPLIRVCNLRVSRGRGRARTEILHDVSLDITAGSLTAFIGTNGAGKTTLAQAIAGVEPPPRGHITLDGIDPGAAHPRDMSERVGFVFQNPEHQFISGTVFDELAHGLRRRRLAEDTIRTQVTAMLDRFGLSHKADVHPFLLSGGEKRRLSVGTALITQPRVLVLDEPTFGQDRARATELLRLLHDVRAEGTTVIIVTHDMQLVAEHASHLVVINNGRIAAQGTTADVFATDILEQVGLRATGVTSLTGIAAPTDNIPLLPEGDA